MPYNYGELSLAGRISVADIFISYAREDREIAESLSRALERIGWEVWWDPVIPTGMSFSEVIEAELDVARCVIVLWSESAASSRWVKREAAYADDRGKLFPAMIGPVEIPLAFRDLEAVDLVGWDGRAQSGNLPKLVADLSRILSQPEGGVGEEYRGESQKRLARDGALPGLATPTTRKEKGPRRTKSLRWMETPTGAWSALRRRPIRGAVAAVAITVVLVGVVWALSAWISVDGLPGPVEHEPPGDPAGQPPAGSSEVGELEDPHAETGKEGPEAIAESFFRLLNQGDYEKLEAEVLSERTLALTNKEQMRGWLSQLRDAMRGLQSKHSYLMTSEASLLPPQMLPGEYRWFRYQYEPPMGPLCVDLWAEAVEGDAWRVAAEYHYRPTRFDRCLGSDEYSGAPEVAQRFVDALDGGASEALDSDLIGGRLKEALNTVGLRELTRSWHESLGGGATSRHLIQTQPWWQVGPQAFGDFATVIFRTSSSQGRFLEFIYLEPDPDGELRVALYWLSPIS